MHVNKVLINPAMHKKKKATDIFFKIIVHVRSLRYDLIGFAYK